MQQETTGAWVALNNNRLKIYQLNGTSDVDITHETGKVYLGDGDNFEIELFNAETTEILAKIWLNNELISTAGLILKPGQRFFLERYIDNNNKFKFETYQVENSTEIQRAIKSNGTVKVEFFRKQQVVPLWQSQYIKWPSPTPINEPLIPHWQLPWYSNNTNPPYFLVDATASFETGRISQGESSTQPFQHVSMEFESFAFSTSEWQILPKSTQPLETSQIRNYCADCGTRVRKQSWKYCPNCGNKLD